MRAPASKVESARNRIAREGWGARLLAHQTSDGRWAGGKGSHPDRGLYSPKWISTTYTMLLLRDFGLPASNRQARKACKLLLDRGLQRDGGIGLEAWKQSETCVTGMVLSILSHFRLDDERLDRIVDHLLLRQMPDGGWNCQLKRGATHASVHTTISVLEGLRDYGLHRGGPAHELRAARMRGLEFLLAHRLYRSHRTGAVIKPYFLRLTFPPRWHYDILRALDYFRAVDAPRDERLADAIDVLRRHQTPGGVWLNEYEYRGRTYFRLEPLGKPSRWNTMRAMRVIAWWEKGRA